MKQQLREERNQKRGTGKTNLQ